MRGYSGPSFFAKAARGAAGALLLATIAGGCERPAEQTSAPPSTRPTPSPVEPPKVQVEPTESAATQASSVQPPATAPTVAAMSIDQRRHEFPPARVVLHNKNGKLTALLYSDDPKDAIKDDYTGNGFYVQMVLDVDHPADIDGAVWRFTSTTSEREDSPFGIFLRGSHQRLQPQNVTVQFDKTDTGLTLWLSGTWMLFDDADDNLTPPRLVPVTARLLPTVTVKPPKS